jgi:hypothetical protein
MTKSNADKVLGALKKKISGRIRIAQQKVARELAPVIVDVVRLRTREEGIGTDGPLKKLEDSTIETRERYSSNLHPDTSPSKSNLTATGQLLDALRGIASQGKVTVDIKPTSRKAELSGKKSKKTLTNNDVREYVEDNGREFLKLSDAENKEVRELATELMQEQFKDLSN